jgi:signal transduction histidine kinase
MPIGLSPGADLALFRIAQEALTNAINHAPGAPIRVRVAVTPRSVDLEVVNGEATGSDTGQGSGRGLIGIRQRVALYNGEMESGPSPDRGFRVRVSLPLETTAP